MNHIAALNIGGSTNGESSHHASLQAPGGNVWTNDTDHTGGHPPPLLSTDGEDVPTGTLDLDEVSYEGDWVDNMKCGIGVQVDSIGGVSVVLDSVLYLIQVIPLLMSCTY